MCVRYSFRKSELPPNFPEMTHLQSLSLNAIGSPVIPSPVYTFRDLLVFNFSGNNLKAHTHTHTHTHAHASDWLFGRLGTAARDWDAESAASAERFGQSSRLATALDRRPHRSRGALPPQERVHGTAVLLRSTDVVAHALSTRQSILIAAGRIRSAHSSEMVRCIHHLSSRIEQEKDEFFVLSHVFTRACLLGFSFFRFLMFFVRIC
jgi:hypothetical protein